MTTVDADRRQPMHPESVRAFLRRETQPLHQAVEDAFAPFDLTSRAGLVGFLTAQHRAVSLAENELDARGIGTVVQDWPERRRAGVLADDLARLGAGSPLRATFDGTPSLDSIGQQFGALYVLEGSRLGGRVLAREVARSADPEVRRATAYLLHRVGGHEPWGTFVEMLERLHAPREHVLDGAQITFEVFRRAALGATLPRLID